MWELGIGTRGDLFGDRLLLAGDDILRSVEFSLGRLGSVVQGCGEGGRTRWYPKRRGPSVEMKIRKIR
jgi:hypothetical protein